MRLRYPRRDFIPWVRHRALHSDVMRDQLRVAQQAYDSKFEAEDSGAKRRIMLVVGSAVSAFTVVYGSYCLSDVTSNIQLARMALYRKLWSPQGAFERLRKQAQSGALSVDYEIDRPWMQTTLVHRRLVNACGGPPCDPNGDWALALIRMGCGFVEIGPVGIAVGTEDEHNPLSCVSPDLQWADSIPDAIHAWRVPVDTLQAKLQSIKEWQKKEEVTMNGLIGIEVVHSDTFEEAVRLCSCYADYLSVRVDDAWNIEHIKEVVASVKCVTPVPLFLKMSSAGVKKYATWLEKVTRGDDLGIVVESTESVKDIRRRNCHINIICTNISSGADAVRAVESGATCFQLSTDSLCHSGPRIAREVKDDFTYLVNVRGHTSLDDARGKARRQNDP